MKKFKLKTRPEKPEVPKLSFEMKNLLQEAYNIFSYELNGKLSVCNCPVCISKENVKKADTDTDKGNRQGANV